jgi:hypothetical protein
MLPFPDERGLKKSMQRSLKALSRERRRAYRSLLKRNEDDLYRHLSNEWDRNLARQMPLFAIKGSDIKATDAELRLGHDNTLRESAKKRWSNISKLQISLGCWPRMNPTLKSGKI